MSFEGGREGAVAWLILKKYLFCLHYKTERLGQLGPRYVFIVTISFHKVDIYAPKPDTYTQKTSY